MAYVKSMKRRIKTHDSVSKCITYICKPDKATRVDFFVL